MKIFFLILLIVLVATALALWFWRQTDHASDHAAMARLAALQPTAPDRFDVSLLEGLPELPSAISGTPFSLVHLCIPWRGYR